MKKLFLLISTLGIFFVLYLIVLNKANMAELVYAYPKEVISLNLASILFVTLIIGLSIGSGVVTLFLKEEQMRLKAYKRELEKTSIQGSNNETKVEVLEAKIKTLEKAFDSVLDERTKLELQIKSLNTELEAINRKKNK